MGYFLLKRATIYTFNHGKSFESNFIGAFVMNQDADPQELVEYKQLLQQLKTANFPETNLRLHTLLRCLGLSKYEIQHILPSSRKWVRNLMLHKLLKILASHTHARMIH